MKLMKWRLCLKNNWEIRRDNPVRGKEKKKKNIYIYIYEEGSTA